MVSFGAYPLGTKVRAGSGRPASGPLRPAPPPHEPMTRKASRVICFPWRDDAPGHDGRASRYGLRWINGGDALVSPAHRAAAHPVHPPAWCGFGNLGAQHGFGSPSQAKVCARNARRPIAELRQHNTSHLGRSWLREPHGSPVRAGLHQAQVQHLGLDLDVISARLTSR